MVFCVKLRRCSFPFAGRQRELLDGKRCLPAVTMPVGSK